MWSNQLHYATTSLLPRSRLYNINPVGLGTKEVESLTSYIARLSDAHCVFVTDLVRHEIFNAMEDLPKSYYQDFFRKAAQINGLGSVANRTIKALESLTMRSDLGHLTMSCLKDIIPPNQLLRQKKTWCTHCYQQWKDKGEIVYDPLLWSFRMVNYCHLHSCRLNSCCHLCGACCTYINKWSKPGYCSSCNSWLGEQVENYRIDNDEQRFEVWVSSNISYMLKYLLLEQDLTRENIRHSLIYFVDTVSKGKPYVFANMVGINPDTFWHCYKGISILSLGDLMRICYFLGVNFEGFINRIRINRTWDLTYRSKQRPSMIRQIDFEIVKGQLEEALLYDSPKSIQEIGRILGINPNRLNKCFPELSQRISEKYKLYRLETSERKEKGLIKQVQEAILHLHSIDIYPSQRAVKNTLNSQNIFIKPKIRRVWRDTLKQLNLNKDKLN